jgi:hypothetical protein
MKTNSGSDCNLVSKNLPACVTHDTGPVLYCFLVPHIDMFVSGGLREEVAVALSLRTSGNKQTNKCQLNGSKKKNLLKVFQKMK